MWDLIALVEYQFENWKSTLWDKIDTENLMTLIKDMQTKQCSPTAANNKDIKNYRAFISLNDRVKNMNTILPLIASLHSKFMMERHWKKLMKITDQEITFQSPKFCLEDLIKLHLYKYAEEVTELVDGAQKEAKIEQKLGVIQKTWEGYVFDFKEYKEVPIFGALDEIIENVETQSMELMGMMSSTLVEYQFENWKSTLWDKIDTENLMTLIKDMQTKQCSPTAANNKDIKNYRAFISLNDRVKNMNTILPLIASLHSKFMMERHWKKLMKITDQEITFQSPKFCLEDLIKLHLYKYAEEVTELVDGAQKEAKIEQKLGVIQKTWEGYVFDFKEYKEVPIFGALDEIIENVETQSMELMGMMSSKDVEEFKERVMFW